MFFKEVRRRSRVVSGLMVDYDGEVPRLPEGWLIVISNKSGQLEHACGPESRHTLL